MNPNNLRHKRTKGKREEDLIETAQLYIRGKSQYEIARVLSASRDYTLTRTQIYKDLKEIHRRWQNAYLPDFNAHKAKELAHIDELERAYWAEYEKSQQDIEEIHSEKIKDTNAGGDGKAVSQWAREKVRAVKKKRDGAPAYLTGVQWCISKRCEILGLNAPQTVNVNWREEAAAEGYDPDQVLAQLESQFIEAARRGVVKGEKNVDPME
jgi:hypothetical protein